MRGADWAPERGPPRGEAPTRALDPGFDLERLPRLRPRRARHRHLARGARTIEEIAFERADGIGPGEREEGAREGAHAREALRRVALEASEDDVVEALREERVDVAGGARDVGADALEERVHAVRGEGGLAGHALVEDRRERVLVARRRAILHPESLLRRHVEHRPGDELGGRERRRRLPGHDLREPEVDQLRDDVVADVAGEKDVRRLEVAVEDVHVVRLRERRRDREEEPERVLDREKVTLREDGAQIGPAEQLHHQVREPRFDPDVEDAHRVRVAEAGRDLPLPHEAGLELLVGDEVLVQDFDRDLFSERDVGGFEDARRRAVADEAHDLVAAEPHPFELLAIVDERGHSFERTRLNLGVPRESSERLTVRARRLRSIREGDPASPPELGAGGDQRETMHCAVDARLVRHRRHVLPSEVAHALL